MGSLFPSTRTQRHPRLPTKKNQNGRRRRHRRCLQETARQGRGRRWEPARPLESAEALGIWVWLGKSATKAERQGVMQMGAKFIKDNKLPPQTALTRTFQGMEPDEFKSLFMEGLADW